MRHTFAIAAGLILSAQSFAAAQDRSPDALETLRAARTELEGLRNELRTLKQSCGTATVDRCGTVASSSRQMILRRYKWVPASTVAAGQQVLSSSELGLGTSGLTSFGAPLSTTQGAFTVAPSSAVGLQYSPLVVNNIGATGFTSGLSSNFGAGAARVQSFAPLSSNVLPASPYAAHQSYAGYDDGPTTQSLSAGFSAAPVYPTATFLGTGGFINAVPAPYYSVY
jgi:hypothetical protein